MQRIEISASPKQLSKLRNGHRVRVGKCMSGSGVSLLVDPAKFDQMTRSFTRGAASQIQLTPDELMANRQAVSQGDISGQGIFAGGKLKVKTLQNVLGVAKKVGEKAGKPFEKTVQVNPFTLGYDLGHDVIAPELKQAPGIRQYYRGGKMKMPSMKKVGKAIVKAEKAVRENPTSRTIVKKVLPVVAKVAVTAAAKRAGLDPTTTKELSGLASEGTTAGLTEAGYGMKGSGKSLMRRVGRKQIRSVTKELGKVGKEVLREVIVPEGKRALKEYIRESMKPRDMEGEGLYAGARGSGMYAGGLLGPPSRLPEVSSLSIGGTLLRAGNPNLASDAMSANFHMNTQLPPHLQRGGIKFV